MVGLIAAMRVKGQAKKMPLRETLKGIF